MLKTCKPYIYIIRHIPSDRLYAGSKFGVDADPDLFFVEGGYFTSSPIIDTLLKFDGVASFIIERIRIFDDPTDAYNYETKFLRKVNAAQNNKFINQHNNARPTPGTIEFEQLMLEKYGIDNIMKDPDHIEWRRDRFRKKYGFENFSQCESVKTKKEKTILSNYDISDIMEIARQGICLPQGIKNISQLEEVKTKKRDSAQRVYGTDNVFQADEIKQKSCMTRLEKYGSEYYSQTKEWKNKQRKELSEKHRRPIIEEIKKLQRKYNLHFGRGWTNRSDINLSILKQQILENPTRFQK